MATLEESKLTQIERKKRIFSEDFKKQKVKEIETKQTTISEVSKAYKVRYNNVHKWVEKYSISYKKGVRLVVEMESETKKRLALQQQVAELERMVGQKQILIDFQAKMIDLAESAYMALILKKIRFSTIVYFWQNGETMTISLNQFYKAVAVSKQNIH